MKYFVTIHDPYEPSKNKECDSLDEVRAHIKRNAKPNHDRNGAWPHYFDVTVYEVVGENNVDDLMKEKPNA